MRSSMASSRQPSRSRPPVQPPAANTEGGGSNIQVVVRCRGRNDREVKAKSRVVVDTSISSTEVGVRVSGAQPESASLKTYSVDHVFGPEADQTMLFDEVVSPIVDDLVEGMNCTVFAYGQTGTGKTYTMSGDDSITEFDTCSQEAGIIPRVLFKLFNVIASRGYDHSVSCSFVELYNEELKDLLDDDDTKKLRIFDDSNKRGVALNGLSEAYVTSATSGLQVLQQGLRKRKVGATKMNELSSRSHTIFSLQVSLDKDGSGEFIHQGKINLVDLAGSENIGKSGAENKRAREAGMINQSLLTLGRVINALVDKSVHIPYRESKLTRLLQDSLGGHTKTCIIATISPASVNIEETLSTLEYASRAKNIKNKPQLNTLSKRSLLADFASDMEKLRLDLAATRAKNGIFLDPKHYEDLMADHESQKMLLNDQQRKLDTMERQLTSTREQVDSTKYDLLQKTKDLQSVSKQLSDTLASLATAESSLSSTRQALEHETSLRKAHASTEGELQTMNTDLLNNLDATIQDINTIHDKLERNQQYHSNARHLLSSTSGQLSDHVNALQEQIEGYGAQQSELAGTLYTNVLEMVKRECARLTDTVSFLDDNMSNLDMLDDGVRRTFNKSDGYLAELLDQANVIKSGVESGLQMSLQSLKSSMSEFGQSVGGELQAFKVQLEKTVGDVGSELRQHETLYSSNLIEKQKGLSQLRTSIEASISATATGYKQSLAELQSALAQEQDRAKNERVKLIEGINGLLTSYSSASESQFPAVLQAVMGPVTSNVQALSNNSAQWGYAIESLQGSESQFNDNMAAKRRHIQSMNGILADSISTKGQQLEAMVEGFKANSSTALEAGLDSAGSQISALDTFIEGMDDKKRANAADFSESLDKLRDSVQHSFGYLINHLGNLQDSVKALGNEKDAEEWAARLAGIWQAVQGQTSSNIAEIRRSLQLLETVELEEEPSGSTPKRRKLGFSRDMPQTSSRPSETPRQPLEELGSDETNRLAAPTTSTEIMPAKRPTRALSKPSSIATMARPRPHRVVRDRTIA